MTITISLDSGRQLVVFSDSWSDTPEDLVSKIKADCKPSTVAMVLITANITFPEWRKAIIAIKPYLKPGAKVEQIQHTHIRTRPSSAGRHNDIVRGLL